MVFGVFLLSLSQADIVNISPIQVARILLVKWERVSLIFRLFIWFLAFEVKAASYSGLTKTTVTNSIATFQQAACCYTPLQTDETGYFKIVIGGI